MCCLRRHLFRHRLEPSMFWAWTYLAWHPSGSTCWSTIRRFLLIRVAFCQMLCCHLTPAATRLVLFRNIRYRPRFCLLCVRICDVFLIVAPLCVRPTTVPITILCLLRLSRVKTGNQLVGVFA